MQQDTIIPVILAGGSGTRLWPLSRDSFPKQFTKNFKGKSLFQMTLERVRNRLVFDLPVIITRDEFRFIVKEQALEIGVEPSHIIIEPSPKNTAAAVALSVQAGLEIQDNGKLLILPCDHYIEDNDAFISCVETLNSNVLDGVVGTIGIRPDRAETGYGYLKTEDKGVFSKVQKFIEKPDIETAREFLKNDKYFWNSGVFLASCATLKELFSNLSPYIFYGVARAYQEGRKDIGFTRLERDVWSQIESISFDYAIMEKAHNVICVELATQWSDLGSWDLASKYIDDNKQSIMIDCDNTKLLSFCEDMHVVGIGLSDIVAIATEDAVLIADKSQAQNVKDAVAILLNNDIASATAFKGDFRPWGNFKSLAKGEGFQVKKIVVNPGGILSLQSHKYRCEHWVVVQGKAVVYVDGQEKELDTNESIYIPVGSLHRLENREDSPLVLIEVQTGSYLGEDDIVRYEDIYNR